MRKIWRGLLLAALCLCIFSTLAFGQGGGGNGSVTGRVTDPSGANVPESKVDLIDKATNIPTSTQTDAAGLYLFQSVPPGTYDLVVTRSGFRKSVIASQQVITGVQLTLNATLEVGATTETVEVTSVAGAELQTESATMGTTLGGAEIMQLPTINRDVSSLVFLQPTVAPTFHNAEGNTTSGQVAGNMSDQNQYLLDGGNNTSDLDGDNGTYVGSRAGAMPTPVESVEEFRVNTNNMTADFAGSNGGQIMVTTKRGGNQFHGSAYDFNQNSDLATNDFFNNKDSISKPQSNYNRFGGSIGGPISKLNVLGGGWYFFANYEGERYPRSGPLIRTVPSDTLREGIIQERDANGNTVQYNLATSTACGVSGGQSCDPRGIGISPVVSQLWSKYEPHCNLIVSGVGDDGLNTCGYQGNLAYPLSTNFGVVRIDHDFGSKWRFFSSYRIFQEDNPETSQTDIGGLIAGDTLGKPAAVSSQPINPRYLVTGLTGTITPTLTNEFHFNYTRNQWQWLRAGATPQLPGISGALEIGGETASALIPVNVDTQDARARLWDGHDYDYKDNVSWLKGTHLFQMGGEFLWEDWRFDRYDNVVGGLTQLVDNISSTGVSFTPDFQPLPCTATQTANCLPNGSIGSWNGLYSELAGIVAATSVVATRTGSNLSLNPLGTPLHSNQTDPTYTAFFSDTWKIKPNLTLSYGLNYSLQMPPVDKNGVVSVPVDASGNPVAINTYLANVVNAANQGQVYNPTLAYDPVGLTGRKYPYPPFYGGFSPRVAIAWSPESKGDGWLSKLLGDKATVIRAGYGRFYNRSTAIGQVSGSVLGDGFLQPVGCQNPNTSNTCTGANQVTPATAFRIGVDGTNPSVGTITPTLQTPVEPGVNAPYATLVSSLDTQWRPAASNSIDFSIQRQFKGGLIAELGYVGVYANHLYQGLDFGNVPYMTKVGGQTFAQAYANLYTELSKGQAPTAQPFFETALKGSSYCTATNPATSQPYANCTDAVVGNQSGSILTQAVTNLWSSLDNSWTAFGPALASTTQCFYCYVTSSDGYSNYNAMTATLQKRAANGLTMQANFTYSHALGLLTTGQAYVLDNATNPFNLNTDYGPQLFDRKFSLNVLASYTLPFGPGHRLTSDNPVAKRILGGWVLSPVFSYASGLPMALCTGSGQEFGNANESNAIGCTNAIPLSIQASSLSNSAQQNVNPTGAGQVGINGSAANGGTGMNLFSNPAAVYADFRPIILGIDNRGGGAGILRGQQRWNLDLGLTKDTKFTERIGAQIYVQAFNVFNHTMFSDPYNSLQDPADFGAIEAQYNAITLGGAGASSNYTRIFQIGLRLYF